MPTGERSASNTTIHWVPSINFCSAGLEKPLVLLDASFSCSVVQDFTSNINSTARLCVHSGYLFSSSYGIFLLSYLA